MGKFQNKKVGTFFDRTIIIESINQIKSKIPHLYNLIIKIKIKVYWGFLCNGNKTKLKPTFFYINFF